MHELREQYTIQTGYLREPGLLDHEHVNPWTRHEPVNQVWRAWSLRNTGLPWLCWITKLYLFILSHKSRYCSFVRSKPPAADSPLHKTLLSASTLASVDNSDFKVPPPRLGTLLAKETQHHFHQYLKLNNYNQINYKRQCDSRECYDPRHVAAKMVLRWLLQK